MGKNLSHKKMKYNYSKEMFNCRAKPIRITSFQISGVNIIIIIFINCNWVITWWQWLFYMYTNMGKIVARKFKSGEPHERHVVATWKLGNHLRIRL